MADGGESFLGFHLFWDENDFIWGVDILVVVERWNWGDKMVSCIARDIKGRGAEREKDRWR